MRIYRRIVLDSETLELLEVDSYEYSGPVALVRGEVNKYNQAEAEKAKLAAGYAPGYQSAATAERGFLLPQYKKIATQPMSEEEKAARTGTVLGGIGSAYDAAAQSAANRMARTRNTAGYGEILDELARSKGRDIGTAEQQVTKDIYDTQFQRQLAGLQGAGNIYGIDTGTMVRLLSGGAPEQQRKGVSLGPLGYFGTG